MNGPAWRIKPVVIGKPPQVLGRADSKQFIQPTRKPQKKSQA
jgi:hypothetical protein